ncbi:MAG: hypothetical protein GY926_01045 [bacterium]|nr:hypothetical protein [bacterium]
MDVPNGADGEVPLILRGILRAAHDGCDCVLRQRLLVWELVGKGLGDRSVANALSSKVGDAWIDLGAVAPVRRIVGGHLLLL